MHSLFKQHKYAIKHTLHRDVKRDTTKVALSVVLEFELDAEGSSGDDGNVNVVIEAVLAAWENFSLVKLDSGSVNNDTEVSNLELEVADNNIITDSTASMDTIVFIDSGSLSQSDVGWGPDVIRLTAALPNGNVVSRSEGEDQSEKEDGFHVDLFGV